MNYKISKEAENYLGKIWLYTFEECSLEQADHYYDLIMNEVEYLSDNPRSGIDYSKVRKGYFSSRLNSNFIFYRINLQEEIVEIIRIHHAQMDIDSHLND